MPQANGTVGAKLGGQAMVVRGKEEAAAGGRWSAAPETACAMAYPSKVLVLHPPPHSRDSFQAHITAAIR